MATKKKILKPKPVSTIQDDISHIIQTLRSLRTWEDQVINELERVCIKVGKAKQSRGKRTRGRSK